VYSVALLSDYMFRPLLS